MRAGASPYVENASPATCCTIARHGVHDRLITASDARRVSVRSPRQGVALSGRVAASLTTLCFLVQSLCCFVSTLGRLATLGWTDHPFAARDGLDLIVAFPLFGRLIRFARRRHVFVGNLIDSTGGPIQRLWVHDRLSAAPDARRLAVGSCRQGSAFVSPARCFIPNVVDAPTELTRRQ